MTLYENYKKHLERLEVIQAQVQALALKGGFEAEVTRMLKGASRYNRHLNRIENFVINLCFSQTDIDNRRAFLDVYKNNPDVKRRTVVRLMEQHKILFEQMEWNVRA